MQGASQQAGSRLYDAKLAALTKFYGARKRSPPKVTILGANPRNPPKIALPPGSRPGTRMTPRRKRQGPVSQMHRGFAALGRQGDSFVAASPPSSHRWHCVPLIRASPIRSAQHGKAQVMRGLMSCMDLPRHHGRSGEVSLCGVG